MQNHQGTAMQISNIKNKLFYFLNAFGLLLTFFYFLNISQPTFNLFRVLPYDDWRFGMLILLALFSLAGLFSDNKIQLSSVLFAKADKLFWLWPAIQILALLSLCSAQIPYRAVNDACLLTLLFASFINLSLFAAHHRDLCEKIYQMIAFTLFAMMLSFLIATAIAYSRHQPLPFWHEHFFNIRFYDELVMPCIFLLWHSCHQGFFRNCANWLKACIYAISAFYMLAIIHDGGRAATLSIFAAVVAVTLSAGKNKKILLAPCLSLAAAFALYYSLLHFDVISSEATATLARTSSSGRSELWLYALQLFQTHPLLGIGGGAYNVLAIGDYPVAYRVLHPHHFILLWLAEWGLTGLALTVLYSAFIYALFRNRQQIPPFIFASSIAITINALLSGSFTYPHTQLLDILLLSFAFSHMLDKQPRSTQTSKLSGLTNFKPLTLVALTYIGFTQLLSAPNIVQLHSQFYTEPMKPRFWQDGRLNAPTRIIIINQSQE